MPNELLFFGVGLEKIGLPEPGAWSIGRWFRFFEEWRGWKTMPHFLWPEPLSAAQLKRLEEHKYSASGRSLFEPPCQIYWTWLVQQIPTWIAPNTLTIIGLLVNVLSTVLLVYYCPTATEEVSVCDLGQSFWTVTSSVYVPFSCGKDVTPNSIRK